MSMHTLKTIKILGIQNIKRFMQEQVVCFQRLVKLFPEFEPEILQLSDERIWQYFKEEPKLEVYRHYIQQIVDNRAHVLSADQESLLAGAGEIFEASSDTFAVLNNADLVFPTIEGENGEKVQLSHGVYGQLLESTDRSVREAAFKGLYSVYEQFRNTFASTLSTHIKDIILKQSS